MLSMVLSMTMTLKMIFLRRMGGTKLSGCKNSCWIVLILFQLYSDAEKSFAQVLKLDKHCEDAMFELARVRVQQLEVRKGRS